MWVGEGQIDPDDGFDLLMDVGFQAIMLGEFALSLASKMRRKHGIERRTG